MKGMLRGVLFCPLNRGKSGAARIGGGERSEPVSRMLFMPYDTESKSRNADFILIALRAIPQPSGPKAPSNLRTLRPRGRSILRTFPFTTLLHNPPPTGGHNPRAKGPSTLMCAFCIECASQPKLALSLPIKGPSYCRLTVRRRVQGPP